ncbi:MAG TPA: M12 family metallo-peptidase [Anaerolineaceae bacterium]|nr:M12 family metallo-peptidase [Anaerolineaceae bacterium]HPN51592.1 M12 family metallo-peptidase [Anaerolineaceae bacterium]
MSSRSIKTLQIIGNLLLICLFVFTSAAQAAPAAEQSGPGLFIEFTGPLPDATTPPHTLDQRIVQVNADALQPVLDGQTLTLDLPLFKDAAYTAVFSNVSAGLNNARIFTGSLAGVADSDVSLVWNGSAFSGSITFPGARFRIEPMPGGLHRIRRVDMGSFPDEKGVIPPLTGPADAQAVTGDDDGSQVDIMLVYTTAVKNHYGSAAAVEAELQQAVNDANIGFAASQVNMRFRLVHMAEMVWNESGFDWNTTLSGLRSKNDGFLDNVHTLRDTYAADLVSMMVMADGAYCGLGYLMGSNNAYYEATAFNISEYDCFVDNYSMAHESGHNMGSHHDRYAAGSDEGVFSYSYGFYVNGNFRTIMAYASGCSSYCGRVNRWSNPNVLYNGLPTGVVETSPSSAYNALSLNNVAITVANFRDGPAPTAPTSLGGAPALPKQINLTWTDNSTNETGFRVERALQGTTSWALLAATTTNSYVDNSVAYDTTYQYRVYAFNGNGSSAFSNVVTVASPSAIPTAPSGLSIIGQAENTITMQWTDNSNNETSFLIQRSDNGSTGWVTVSTAIANATSGVDTSALCESTYYYRVLASNSGANSTPSNMASGTTAICTPTSPVATAAARPVATDINLITWSDTANEGYYQIERSTNGATFTATFTVPINQTAFMNTGLTPNTLYYYRVSAVNKLGASTPSPVVQARTYLYAIFTPLISKP